MHISMLLRGQSKVDHLFMRFLNCKSILTLIAWIKRKLPHTLIHRSEYPLCFAAEWFTSHSFFPKYIYPRYISLALPFSFSFLLNSPCLGIHHLSDAGSEISPISICLSGLILAEPASTSELENLAHKTSMVSFSTTCTSAIVLDKLISIVQCLLKFDWLMMN